MAWNGTVTCSYCYTSGHNKRGCPKLKAEIAEARAEDPDSWRVEHYDGHRARTSRKGEVRTCTYCQEEGHNRRTCAHLKGHVLILEDKNRRFRAVALDWLRTSGVGVGSFLTSTDWRGRTFNYLVTGIEWRNISYLTRRDNYKGCGHFFKVRNIANLTNGELFIGVPGPTGEGPHHAFFDEMQVQTTTATVRSAKGGSKLAPPAGWLDTEGFDAKGFLKEYTKYHFDNGYI